MGQVRAGQVMGMGRGRTGTRLLGGDHLPTAVHDELSIPGVTTSHGAALGPPGSTVGAQRRPSVGAQRRRRRARGSGERDGEGGGSFEPLRPDGSAASQA